MSMDLHLKYIRTDSAGTPVYEKYLSEDRITLLKPMGEVKLFGEIDWSSFMHHGTGAEDVVGGEFKPVKTHKDAAENITGHNVLMQPDDKSVNCLRSFINEEVVVPEEITLIADGEPCWANNPVVTCQCPRCRGDMRVNGAGTG
jgi:hypothetical protein